MPGVRTEPRHVELARLLTRVEQELSCARRRQQPGRVAELSDLRERVEAELDAEVATLDQPPEPPGRVPDKVTDRLREIGVDVATVRAWGLRHGLLRPGRTGLWLVEAYAAARPPAEHLGGPCPGCGRTLIRHPVWTAASRIQRKFWAADGYRRAGGRGYCTACYQERRVSGQLTPITPDRRPSGWPCTRCGHPSAPERFGVCDDCTEILTRDEAM